MERENFIELLAPAGSVTGLKAVIEAGADAVYIGGSRFGARAYAENPEEDDLVSAIDYAHARGVRVYLTVNTLLKEEELRDLKDYITPYYLHGLDAVLVQDFGVLKYLHETFPDLPLHASTQMTVTGPYSARMLGEYGVQRVVPARELSLEELREIRLKSGLEVEAFVHGAICVCYSGQCLMSSMIGGRSGNRGRCAQPCRLRYTLSSADRKKTSERKSAQSGEFLSPKDMCTLDFLPDMIEAGVCSFKIEGRMKQPEYGAGVVSIYRKYLDRYKAYGRSGYSVTKKDRQMLLTLFNRDGFTEGYLKKHNGPEMIAADRHTLNEQEERARAELYEKLNHTYVSCDTSLEVSGTVSVICGKPLSLRVTELRTGSSVTVYGEKVLKAETRPLSQQRISEQISKTGGSGYRFRDIKVITDGESFVPMAQLNALRRKAFSALTDELLSAYMRPLTGISCSASSPKDHNESFSDPYKCALTASVETEEQFDAVLSEEAIRKVYIPYRFLSGRHFDKKEVLKRGEFYLGQARQRGKELWLAMPYIERRDGIADPENFAGDLIRIGFSGFLVRSFETMARLREEGLEKYIRTDSSIYTCNSQAAEFLGQFGFDKDTVPIELNRKEIQRRMNCNSEMIIYGHLPLMITAQCLQKTTSVCTRSYPSLALRDRKSRVFTVECDCTFCYNIIRNPVVLSLIGEINTIRTVRPASMRLIFTNENRKKTAEVCAVARNALSGNSQEDIDGEHTKGHFNRGVE